MGEVYLQITWSSEEYWCCIFSNINGEMAHIGDLEFQVDKVLIVHSGESIEIFQDCAPLVNESSKGIDLEPQSLLQEENSLINTLEQLVK